MLLWCLHISPAIHGSAWDPLKNHDLAWPRRGQRRENKIFAYSGNQVETDGRVGIARAHILYIGECQCALWFVVGRTAGVFLKQRTESSFACGNNCQILATCIRFYIGYLCFSDHEFAATALEFIHPPWHLDPLIHSLRVRIQTRRPIDHFRTVRPRNAEADSLDSGAFLL